MGYDECLEIATTHNRSANAHVADFNYLLRNIPLNNSIRPLQLPSRNKNNPYVGRYIIAPEDLLFYKYPYVSSDSKFANGEKALLLLESLEGVFPHGWFKVQ